MSHPTQPQPQPQAANRAARRRHARHHGKGQGAGEILPFVRLPNGKVQPARTANLAALPAHAPAPAPDEPEGDPLPPGALQLDIDATQELAARLQWIDQARREIARLQVGLIMGEESTDTWLIEKAGVAFYSDPDHTWKLDVQRGRLLPTPRHVPAPSSDAPAQQPDPDAEEDPEGAAPSPDAPTPPDGEPAEAEA